MRYTRISRGEEMTAKSSSSQRLLWEGIGLALVSAGSLCFEINLTRLFSVAQFYHFAFMVVSMALLGYGVSGTVLSLFYKEKQDKNEPIGMTKELTSLSYSANGGGRWSGAAVTMMASKGANSSQP